MLIQSNAAPTSNNTNIAPSTQSHTDMAPNYSLATDLYDSAITMRDSIVKAFRGSNSNSEFNLVQHLLKEVQAGHPVTASRFPLPPTTSTLLADEMRGAITNNNRPSIMSAEPLQEDGVLGPTPIDAQSMDLMLVSLFGNAKKPEEYATPINTTLPQLQKEIGVPEIDYVPEFSYGHNIQSNYDYQLTYAQYESIRWPWMASPDVNGSGLQGTVKITHYSTVTTSREVQDEHASNMYHPIDFGIQSVAKTLIERHLSTGEYGPMQDKFMIGCITSHKVGWWETKEAQYSNSTSEIFQVSAFSGLLGVDFRSYVFTKEDEENIWTVHWGGYGESNPYGPILQKSIEYCSSQTSSDQWRPNFKLFQVDIGAAETPQTHLVADSISNQARLVVYHK